jgi:hypothetical protein
MKIQPRYYPTILLVTYVIFLLIGLLLGFLPRGGGEHESSSWLPLALTLEVLA